MRTLAHIVSLFVVITSGWAEAVRFSKEGPHNFGIVVHNEAHTIYRSAGLGKNGLKDIARYLKERGLPFPTTIIHMNIDGYSRSIAHLRNFAVEEYEEQQRYGYKYYHSFDYDFSTYLNGLNPYEAHKNVNQINRLGGKAQAYFGFRSDVAILGGMDAFYRILDLVFESKGPVLVHCTAGQHRTGMISMALRYLQGGEWRQGSYYVQDRGILNAAQYEYFLHNSTFYRNENIKFIEQWARDPEFQDYVQRYQSSLNLPSLLHH